MRLTNLLYIVPAVHSASTTTSGDGLSAIRAEDFLYHRHIQYRRTLIETTRGRTHFCLSGCCYGMGEYRPPGRPVSLWDEDLHRVGVFDLFPGGICLNETAIADLLPTLPCENCTAILHEEWNSAGEAALICEIPELEEFHGVQYVSSKWLGDLHQSLVKADPRYIALGYFMGTEDRDALFRDNEGRFTASHSRDFNVTVSFIRMTAPEGSIAHHMCGFIARYVAPRFIESARPEIARFMQYIRAW